MTAVHSVQIGTSQQLLHTCPGVLQKYSGSQADQFSEHRGLFITFWLKLDAHIFLFPWGLINLQMLFFLNMDT